MRARSSTGRDALPRPRSKTAIVADLLYRSKLLRICKPLGAANLVVFNYHRVAPDDPHFAPAFDDSVYGVSASRFETHVRWLKDNLRVLSVPELAAIANSGEYPPEPCAMITFDDGYRDNYDLAYPILKRHQLPATFFIPTGVIESRLLGWWDQIPYLIKNTRASSIVVDGSTLELEGHRDDVVLTLCRKMKLDDIRRTQNLVPELAAACGVALPDCAAQDRELMTWDQIREMADGGMCIGSHTHSHRVLARLSAAEQREELSRARQILEEKVGRPVLSLAYPAGRYSHFTRETMAIARECGYELAFSFCTGVNQWRSLSRYDVKRWPTEFDVSQLAAIATLPAVFVRP